MWTVQNNYLYKEITFKNFSEAFTFMTNVAKEVEKLNHHPLWTNCYNKVEIWLNTKDTGNMITDVDYELAERIDLLLYQPKQ